MASGDQCLCNMCRIVTVGLWFASGKKVAEWLLQHVLCKFHQMLFSRHATQYGPLICLLCSRCRTSSCLCCIMILFHVTTLEIDKLISIVLLLFVLTAFAWLVRLRAF